ncbi:hypothetical protein DRP04_13425 [Archaeoglobales archaeon]|nr:MAG: hypothetical protein DRP04_13425 [Archaeoglobales archaeon]
MKKVLLPILISILILIILISIPVLPNPKTVKPGDTVSANYIAMLEDGTVIDTSYEEVARENGIYDPEREYGPVNFTVGVGMLVEGLDEGIIGMKEGEKRKIVVPPEKGYGRVNLSLIERIPIIERIPYKKKIPRYLTTSLSEFEFWFGKNHSVGEKLFLPAGYYISVVSMNETNVTVRYELKEGDVFKSSKGSWNLRVVEVCNESITVIPDFKVGDTVRIYKYFWNSTVINIADGFAVVRHNPIPDFEFVDVFNVHWKIHFCEDVIIIDRNHPLAGKTLIFEIEIEKIY